MPLKIPALHGLSLLSAVCGLKISNPHRCGAGPKKAKNRPPHTHPYLSRWNILIFTFPKKHQLKTFLTFYTFSYKFFLLYITSITFYSHSKKNYLIRGGEGVTKRSLMILESNINYNHWWQYIGSVQQETHHFILQNRSN